MIKDHPFVDGCKRIAAAIFLEFLNKNNALIKDNQQVISNNALVAITLMIAESRPEEKEIDWDNLDYKSFAKILYMGKICESNVER